jgi:hypothetical protein
MNIEKSHVLQVFIHMLKYLREDSSLKACSDLGQQSL